MGLMFRERLETDHGMLFLFEKPKRQGFWMKNTKIHLDIGYFDTSGTLVEVYRLFPYDETPVPSRSDQILIAVEMDLGWFELNGIHPGARLDSEALSTAIKARGYSPEDYPFSE